MSGNQTKLPSSSRLHSVAKVSARTRLSETTEAIRQLVLDGVIPTGGRVKDQELALALGVSRATVREAVRELVHQSLLVHEAYKGLRVASIDDQSWLELSQVRAALEVLGAQLVAAKLTPELDARLESAMDELREARDVADRNEAHIALHALLQRLAGNEILEQTWALVEQRARVVLRIDYEVDPALDRVKTHEALLTAIRTKDDAVIAKAVYDHVLTSARDRMERRHVAVQVGHRAKPHS